MKSVKNHENTIIIKNSKFICCLYFLKQKEDIITYLNETKENYPNATHYCYAYIYRKEKKESDDGEPSGTAGIPILQVLEKNKLNQVLCIVVRYFGKIKLGAGGLIRAYTKSVTEALKNHIITLTEGYCVNLIFPYSVLKNVDYLLKDAIIVKKQFQDKISYQIHTNLETIEKLKTITEIEIEICHSLYLSE